MYKSHRNSTNKFASNCDAVKERALWPLFLYTNIHTKNHRIKQNCNNTLYENEILVIPPVIVSMILLLNHESTVIILYTHKKKTIK